MVTAYTVTIRVSKVTAMVMVSVRVVLTTVLIKLFNAIPDTNHKANPTNPNTSTDLDDLD